MSAEKRTMKVEEKKRKHRPFDGEGFEVWFERLKLKMERKGLWMYCEKEIDEPEEAKEQEHNKWKKETMRAKELVYDNMTDKIMKTVKFEPTVYRVVERLKQRFVGKTYFKYAAEMTQLRKLRLQNDGNVSDHLGEVRRLMDRIALLGKPLNEYEKPALLISTLPETYDNVVETFLASHTPCDINDPPNYEQLEHALELAFDRRQGRKADETQVGKEQALFSDSRRGRGRGRGRGRDPNQGRRGRGRSQGRSVGWGRGAGKQETTDEHVNDGNEEENDDDMKISEGRTWKRGCCFHCKQWGHYLLECPYLGKGPPQITDENTHKKTKVCGGRVGDDDENNHSYEYDDGDY